MEIRKAGLWGAGALVALGLWCLWLWQPERQLLLHQRHLLNAFERRDWEDVAGFVGAEYGDRWGHDKRFLLQDSGEVLRHFLFLQIRSEIERAKVDGLEGKVAARLKLAGRGSPVAELAMDRVNRLGAPWTFEWRRKSWRPWDWELVSADHRELDIEASALRELAP